MKIRSPQLILGLMIISTQLSLPILAASPKPGSSFLDAFSRLNQSHCVVIGEIVGVENANTYSRKGRVYQYPELEIHVNRVLFGETGSTIMALGKNTYIFQGDLWVPKVITGGCWAMPGDRVLAVIENRKGWDSTGAETVVPWARRIAYVEGGSDPDSNAIYLNVSSETDNPKELLSDRSTPLSALLLGVSREMQPTGYTVLDVIHSIEQNGGEN